MLTVRLETRSGHFVADVLVPEFKLMPEGLMWGMRFFVPAKYTDNPRVYTEGMLYAVTLGGPSDDAP